MHEIVETLARAALPHVPFDGWSDETFRLACIDCGIDPALARLHAPRGGIDLAVAAHVLGDREMRKQLAALDLSGLRFRDRVIEAVMLRLTAAGDRESVRRASAMFALPQHAAEGARLVWATVGQIWEALGDTSDDLNWYTKRATLTAVYGSSLLYWLGDDSPDLAPTRDFVTRRIEGVMAFEATKAKLRANPLTSPLMKLQAQLASCVKAPAKGQL